MSLYDYKASQDPYLESVSFYGLVMAAIRRADTENLVALRVAFPDVYEEFYRRYHAPGGRLPEDKPVYPGTSVTNGD